MTKQVLKTAAATGLLGAAILFAPMAAMPAQAYQCKNSPTKATGSSRYEIRARMKATRSWSATVKLQIGLPWSLWKIATNKSVTCGKSIQGDKWRCLASGNACLYVVN